MPITPSATLPLGIRGEPSKLRPPRRMFPARGCHLTRMTPDNTRVPSLLSLEWTRLSNVIGERTHFLSSTSGYTENTLSLCYFILYVRTLCLLFGFLSAFHFTVRVRCWGNCAYKLLRRSDLVLMFGRFERVDGSCVSQKRRVRRGLRPAPHLQIRSSGAGEEVTCQGSGRAKMRFRLTQVTVKPTDICVRIWSNALDTARRKEEK